MGRLCQRTPEPPAEGSYDIARPGLSKEIIKKIVRRNKLN